MLVITKSQQNALNRIRKEYGLKDPRDQDHDECLGRVMLSVRRDLVGVIIAVTECKDGGCCGQLLTVVWQDQDESHPCTADCRYDAQNGAWTIGNPNTALREQKIEPVYGD